MKKLLLSTCCGPCATVALERLAKEYDVTVFFWGNNIHPREEYERRLEAVLKLAPNAIVAEYKPLQPTSCKQCFEMRLKATADLNFDYFATTLTTSPHKDAKLINQIGAQYKGYVPTDFKKNNGFARSVILSKQLGLYRQNYCGCERSRHQSPAGTL